MPTYRNIAHDTGLLVVESRLAPLKGFATFAVISLLIWSAVLEAAFFYTGFVEMLGNEIVVITITIMLVLLLEGCKFYFGAFAFRFIVQGWLKEGWVYRLAYLILLPLSITVFAGSIYLNINGPPQVAVYFMSQTSKPVLENLDSIDHYFDSRQASLVDQKENVLNIKHRGKITYQASVIFSQLQTQSNHIEMQRDSALARAQRKNDLLLSQSIDHSHNWGIWLSRFGGFGEGLTLLFLLFIEVYDNARQISVGEHSGTNEATNTKRRQKKRQFGTTLHPQESVAVGVVYENKSYPPSRFKDWLDKVEFRSRESVTASARLRNIQRHSEMLASWNKYLSRTSA